MMINLRTGTLSRKSGELDQYVEAFEAAHAAGGPVKLADYLPPAEHPLYLSILREIVRADLEFAWERGERRYLESYRETFPELFCDQASLAAVAYEEYRLRLQAGDPADRHDYSRRYGLDTSAWPATIRQESSSRRSSLAGDGASASASPAVPTDATAICKTPSQAHVHDASHFELGPVGEEDPNGTGSGFPQPGSDFLDFHLLRELGRGTFGRVYLAEQGELARRRVALKVSTELIGESQILAQLQHTHIMPIYSLHRLGRLQAVCMPYLGSTTLADVLREIKDRHDFPDSGRWLVTTLADRKGKTLPDRPPSQLETAEAAGEDSVVEVESEDDAPAPESFRILSRLSYTDAVLWIGARLAEGLAHAHERGIVHQDLKPANVLLGDEGQPLLLDFNLAVDTRSPRRSAAPLGGTLPYMAPEQIRALQGKAADLDGRCDIYALGVILFQLLTGRLPFPVPEGKWTGILPKLLEDRKQPVPSIRSVNRDIPPSVESIVRKCLAFDSAERYQTARQLFEDLQCQQNHLPLRHAPNPSWRERLQKWSRRHPRLTASSTVIAVAATVLVVVSVGFLVRQRNLRRLEAAQSWHALVDESKTLPFLLMSPDSPLEQVKEGLALGRRLLQPYGVLDDHDWLTTSRVTYLPETEQRRLRTQVGEVLLMLARGATRQATATGEPDQRNALLEQALDLNRRAEACFSAQTPRYLWQQRAELLQRLGREQEARSLQSRADSETKATPRDHYWDILARLDQGQMRQAIAFLQQAARRDSGNAAVRLVLGNCYASLGRYDEAIDCYDIGIALDPDSPWAYFNRGLAHLAQKRYSLARTDFDAALRLRPELIEAFVNRALARMGEKDYSGAVADLTHALEAGSKSTRIYFIRSRAYRHLGRMDRAQADLQQGLTRVPVDDLSWVARAVAKITTDPEDALRDLDQALALNPRCRQALQNKAHVLAERLGRVDEAIRVLDQAVAWYPDYLPARLGRAVLLARQGKREAAHRDVAVCLTGDPPAIAYYQSANVYALTSRQEPKDLNRALQLLRTALRRDPSWFAILPRDPDFEPIRQEPEFRELVRAAKAVARE